MDSSGQKSQYTPLTPTLFQNHVYSYSPESDFQKPALLTSFDSDLVEVIQAIASNRMTEAYAMQTIIKLVLECRELRQQVRVMTKLVEPTKEGTATETKGFVNAGSKSPF